MNLKINEEALKWYKDELDLKEGDQVRFFVRYGGCSNVQKGFSLGVSKDEPQQIGVSAEKTALRFSLKKAMYGISTAMICLSPITNLRKSLF